MSESTREGVVVRIDGGGHHVEVGSETWRCRVRGRIRRMSRDLKNPVAVGDRVRVAPTSPGEGVIEEVEARRTKLSRPAVGSAGKEHLIAANVDQVLIVVAAREPPLRPAFIDRILIAAERGGIDAVVCLNKVDLDEDGRATADLKAYERIGVRVIHASAARRQGLVSLREVLQGRTSVLAGHSGVGKSSLLTALSPALALRTAEVSDRTGKGRHTTTSASLLPLEFGGYVVDTPGVRAFGLAGLAAEDVAIHYPEMRPYIDACKFRSCRHTHEPGCAVKEALAGGRISPIRYGSYVKIVQSIEAGLEGEERERGD